jgi:Arc/MetJ-type ribon-helix-helix transcriptional regulator
MPRPFLPDDLRKDPAMKVRFLESERSIILEQVKKHKCKTMSEYVRKLIKEDIARTKRSKSLPNLC